MAAQNFKKEDWENGDTKLGQNWHKNFQTWFKGNLRKLARMAVVSLRRLILYSSAAFSLHYRRVSSTVVLPETDWDAEKKKI